MASVVVYTVIAMAATIAAYLLVFIQFAPYDDEGTLLVTLNAFANGDVLYRDIYSPYGPFYYEVFGTFFSLTGLPVSTDVSRTIVIVVWVATSFVFGVAAQRLTGRLAIGATAMIAAFASLQALTSEPMHPHGLSVLLLALFTLLVVSKPRRVLWAGAAAGALIAALVLTKLNLGAFALAALALAAVATCAPFYRRRWLRWPVVLGFLALPILIMARDLGTAWVRDLVLLEVFAAGAIVVAAASLHPQPGDDDAVPPWLSAFALAFAAASAAILAVILLTGPTPADLYDGMVREAMRVRDVLVTPLPFPPAAVSWGLAALAAAILVRRLGTAGSGAVTIWPALLRAAAGLAILFSISDSEPLGLNPAAGNPIIVPLLLAWVAAFPPEHVRNEPYQRFVRVLLPALAVVESLQVYPVAGSQMKISAVIFVPVGAICLNDALTSLRLWNATRGAREADRLRLVTPVLLIALAAMFALNSILRPAVTNAITYRDWQALPFSNATLLHLPPEATETYTRIVGLLEEHRCTDFVGYPNINSLYLWSGIEAPPPKAPGAWIEALDREGQERVVDSLRASPRPCAIRNETVAKLWLDDDPIPDGPLVGHIFRRFEPVEQVGEFEFLLPKTRVP